MEKNIKETMHAIEEILEKAEDKGIAFATILGFTQFVLHDMPIELRVQCESIAKVIADELINETKGESNE